MSRIDSQAQKLLYVEILRTAIAAEWEDVLRLRRSQIVRYYTA